MRQRGRFGPVLGRGRRTPGRLLQLIIDEAAGGSDEAGFVVARKLLPTAVARNRARRLMREAFRRRRASFSGLIVIMRLRQRPEAPGMRDLADEAAELLDRAAALLPQPGLAPRAGRRGGVER